MEDNRIFSANKQELDTFVDVDYDKNNENPNVTSHSFSRDSWEDFFPQKLQNHDLNDPKFSAPMFNLPNYNDRKHLATPISHPPTQPHKLRAHFRHSRNSTMSKISSHGAGFEFKKDRPELHLVQSAMIKGTQFIQILIIEYQEQMTRIYRILYRRND